MNAVEFVKKYGVRILKIAVENAPSNAESYWNGYYFRENPQFEFNNGFHPVWNLTENEGDYFKKRGFDPIPIQDLKRLVDSYDLVMEHGSLDRAKEYAESPYTAPEIKCVLLKAIANVEKCQ